METEFQKSIFYRTLMTSVFVGLVGTLLTMFYDLVFVEYLKFPLSAIINVASLIFAVNIVFLVIGLLYYYFITSFSKGDILYIVIFILLTAFFTWKAEGVHRTADAEVNTQFRNLLAGIVVIMGILAAFAVPFLYHNKRFEDAVL